MIRKLVFLAILFFSFQSFAADVTLQWDVNPPEDQVISYQLHYTDGVTDWTIYTGNVTEYILTNLTHNGTYVISLSAYNTVGMSANSTPVTYTVPAYAPPPENPKPADVVEIQTPANLTVL